MSHHNNHNNEGAKPVNVFADKPTEREPQAAAEQKKRDNSHDVYPSDIGIHPANAPAAVAAEDAPKEKERVTLSMEVEDETPDLIVELSKIYAYDDEEIKEIDLTGIDNISNKDQEKAMKLYRKMAKNPSVTPEFTPEYAVAIAHVLTEIPIEIIKQFSFKDKIKLKNAVMGFLYSDN